MTTTILPVDAHTHIAVDRDRVVALRSVHLHEASAALAGDRGPLCVGLHPWFVRAETLDDDLARLETIALSGRLAALGETGLDRTRGAPLAVQSAAMRGHVALSERLGLPLVVHCARAGSDLLELRKSTRAAMPWLWHGWNGSPQQTRSILETDSVPSFGASILDVRSRGRAVLADLPPGSFLLETDESDRPIEAIEAEAASLRGVAADTLRAELHRTWSRLFAPARSAGPT